MVRGQKRVTQGEKKGKTVLQQQSGAVYNPLTKSREDDLAEKKYL